VGSVFSPYYRSALKRGPADPENYCSLNVALYGRNRRWTMTERGRRSIARDAHNFTIGPSSLQWHGDHLEIDICEIGVPIPFSVRGKVRVYPESLSTFCTALDNDGRHRWGPLAPCARVEVDLEKPYQRWKGHAYLDSNEGDEPISEPFKEWDWSRATLDDGSTAVIYDVQKKQGDDRLIGVRFAKDGAIEEFVPPPRQDLELTGWRIPRRMRSEGDAPVQVIDMLEDTPFYERSVLKSRLFGQDVISVHETLNVPRLVSPVVQRMLPFRMPRLG
jgi:carotenoid 1,2-hydratase